MCPKYFIKIVIAGPSTLPYAIDKQVKNAILVIMKATN
jgi:hypothetical protein